MSANLLKKTLTQVFSCEIYKLFKKIYFEEHLWTSASKHYLKRDSNSGASCEFCKLFKNTYFLEDLQTACSETPGMGSFFKKAASLTAWKLLTVLERDSHRYFSVNFEKFLWKLFCRILLANTSHMMLFFSFFQISEVCSLKSVHLVEQW